MIILATIGVLAAAGTTLGIVGTCLGGSAKKEVGRIRDSVSDHERRINDCEHAIVASTNAALKSQGYKFDSVASICNALDVASTSSEDN